MSTRSTPAKQQRSATSVGGSPAAGGAHGHTPEDRIAEMLLQLQPNAAAQQQTPQRSNGKQPSESPRLRASARQQQQQQDAQANAPRQSPFGLRKGALAYPSSSGSEGEGGSDSDDPSGEVRQARSHAARAARRPAGVPSTPQGLPRAPAQAEWADDRLDQSGEFDEEEREALDRLLREADARTQPAAARVEAMVAQQQSATLRAAATANESEDDSQSTAADNAALQKKIAAERAVLGNLIEQLTALQSQAAQLKQLTMLSRDAELEKQSILNETRRHVEEELELDEQGRGHYDIEESEEEEEEQQEEAVGSSDAAQTAAARVAQRRAEFQQLLQQQEALQRELAMAEAASPVDSEEDMQDSDADQEAPRQSSSRRPAGAQPPLHSAESPLDVPEDEDVEVEIERRPSSGDLAQSSDDEEIKHDQAELASLERLLGSLMRNAEAQSRAQRQARQAQGATQEELERDDEERETDERLFFGTQPPQQQQPVRRSVPAVAQRPAVRPPQPRYPEDEDEEEDEEEEEEQWLDDSTVADEADEDERMEKMRRQQNSERSPLTSGSPSPPHVRQRARTAPLRRMDSSEWAAESIARLPARAVPPVPISRWIGPSTLPQAHAGGGSGRHAQYADRPATAVGTARSIVRGYGGDASAYGQNNQQSASSRDNGAVPSNSGGTWTASSGGGITWQAPTLSSLPPEPRGPRQHKAASVSSKGSLFVNAPSLDGMSMVSSRRGGVNGDEAEAEGDAEPSIAEDSGEDAYETIDDFEDDYEPGSSEEEEAEDEAERALQEQVYGRRAARQGAAMQGSPEPSDSDSELPYNLNSQQNGLAHPISWAWQQQQQQQSQQQRPKSARAPVGASNLNGRALPDARRQQWSNYAPAAAPSRVSTAPAPVRSAPAPSARAALSSSDLQAVWAFIGGSIFRSAIDVGHTGATGAHAPQLGGGRLGMSTGAGAAAAAQPQTRPQQPRGYGFQPAVPVRDWRANRAV